LTDNNRIEHLSASVWCSFLDNACVITNEKGDVQGSDIKGPVSREAAERWPRIAANAKQIV
jgi:large subunit ribosomal protein L14